MLIDAARLMIFPACMAFAASSDLITMTISNRLSLLLTASFFLMAAMVGMPLAEIGSHVGAGALILVCTFVFFARGWIGGGDAKLAAAVALWFGWSHLYEYLLYASLMGGALTLAIVEWRKYNVPALLARQEWIARLHRPNGDIPYGIALAAAALVVYPSTVWLAG
jgi:prepilin peptidase CpaA